MPSEIKPDFPSTLATGLGAGAVAGTGSGLLKNIGNWHSAAQLKGQLTGHEASIAKLQELLSDVRGRSPNLQNMGDRQLTSALLQRQLPNEAYHTLRQGAEGLSGRSRASKLIRMLKGQNRRRLVRHGLLGAGIGLGGGLLGATALGHFDKESSYAVDMRTVLVEFLLRS